MIHPKDSDIGRRVIYRSTGGDVTEEGTISSITPSFVFVLYGTTVAATERRCLEWATPCT
jgi:hypothetical protein